MNIKNLRQNNVIASAARTLLNIIWKPLNQPKYGTNLQYTVRQLLLIDSSWVQSKPLNFLNECQSLSSWPMYLMFSLKSFFIELVTKMCFFSPAKTNNHGKIVKLSTSLCWQLVTQQNYSHVYQLKIFLQPDE